MKNELLFWIEQQRLANAFRKKGPWVTKFKINEKEFGGKYDAMNDHRIPQFFQAFPDAAEILELGSLEGGHTFAIEKNPQVKKITAIEGRHSNIERAKFIQKLLNAQKIEFIESNLEHIDFTTIGKFDAVYCCGLLYHLLEPWKLIESISKISGNLFLSTHYSLKNEKNINLNGFEGSMYNEFGLKDSLSGMSPKSFWPTLDALMNILKSSGFQNIIMLENTPNHQNGPIVTLSASK